MASEASLEGLPRELRLHIYDYVFALDLDCTVIDGWRDTHTQQHGFRSVPELSDSANFVVPWLSLMLTCKNFASELRSIMDEKRFVEDAEKTAWTLDLEAKRGGMALGNITIQRMPCPPGQVRTVVASYNTKSGFQAWGDGSPQHVNSSQSLEARVLTSASGITSGLYQTLNFIVHCGPRFNPKRQLPRPLHLEELRVKVESRDHIARQYDDENYLSLSDRETNPETTLYALGSIVGQIVNTGVLRGYVDMISVCTADNVLSWTPREVRGDGIPEYWVRNYHRGEFFCVWPDNGQQV